MKSTDSEPQGGGMELEQYRTSLEQMVEEKSKDLIAIQENLEATNRRQALFIKVLQILQLEPDIPTAMNRALAEIGRYTGVAKRSTGFCLRGLKLFRVRFRPSVRTDFSVR